MKIIIIFSLFVFTAYGIADDLQRDPIKCGICTFRAIPENWNGSTGAVECKDYISALEGTVNVKHRTLTPPTRKSDFSGAFNDSINQDRANMFTRYSNWVRGYVDSINQTCGSKLEATAILDLLADQCKRKGNESDSIGKSLYFVFHDETKAEANPAAVKSRFDFAQ